MENRHALPSGTDCTYYLICRFCNEFKSRSMFASKTTSSCQHPFDSFAKILAQLQRGASNNDFLTLTPKNAICAVCLHAYVSGAETARVVCPFAQCTAKFWDADVQRLLTPARFTRFVKMAAQQRRVAVKILECTVCFEPLSAVSLPRTSVTAACEHDMNVCASCVRGFIMAAVTDGSWAHPTCPECMAPLSHAEMAVFVERTVLARHDEHVFLASIGGMAEFRWCLRVGCKFGQLHLGGAEEPIVTCRKCEMKTCFVHGVMWHEGVTCAAFQEERERREREEAGTRATMEHLRQRTKPCPRMGCGIRIEKNGGCDHMICRKCGHRFNWSSAPGHGANPR